MPGTSRRRSPQNRCFGRQGLFNRNCLPTSSAAYVSTAGSHWDRPLVLKKRMQFFSSFLPYLISTRQVRMAAFIAALRRRNLRTRRILRAACARSTKPQWPSRALTTPSPHHLRTAGPRTAAIRCVELELVLSGLSSHSFSRFADAAFARTCSDARFAVERVSPEQPLKSAFKYQTPTVLFASSSRVLSVHRLYLLGSWIE